MAFSVLVPLSLSLSLSHSYFIFHTAFTVNQENTGNIMKSTSQSFFLIYWSYLTLPKNK